MPDWVSQPRSLTRKRKRPETPNGLRDRTFLERYFGTPAITGPGTRRAFYRVLALAALIGLGLLALPFIYLLLDKFFRFG